MSCLVIQNVTNVTYIQMSCFVMQNVTIIKTVPFIDKADAI